MQPLLRLIPRTILRNGLRPSIRRIATRIRPDVVPPSASPRITPHLPPQRLLRDARLFSSSPTNPEPLIVRKGYLAWGFPPRPGESRRLVRYLVGGTASLVAITMVGMYVTHLEQVPESGRWRVMYFTPEDDAEIAQTRHEHTRRIYELGIVPADHPLSIDIRNIARRIIEANDLGVVREPTTAPPPSAESEGDLNVTTQASKSTQGPQSTDTDSSPLAEGSKYVQEWDIIVVNDPKTVNAQVDTGQIVVFTGILSVCDDEETFAAVLSHEIAHVVARHISERFSARFFSLLGLRVINLLTLSTDASLFVDTIGVPHYKIHETEADVMSLRLLANACYNPEAALRFQQLVWEREPAHRRRESVIGEYLATHPTTDVRIKDITQHLPRAMELFRAERTRRGGTCGPTVREQMEQFRQRAGLKPKPVKTHLYNLSTILLGHPMHAEEAAYSRRT